MEKEIRKKILAPLDEHRIMTIAAGRSAHLFPTV
jgi:hypothetical protein